MSAMADTTTTEFLQRWGRGDERAAEEVLPRLYEELRRIANGIFRSQPRNHTLQPTALVHETWLHLNRHRGVPWQGRSHFLGVAARVMRQLLVDHSRRRNADKRGGGQALLPIDLPGVQNAASEEPAAQPSVLDLDAALRRLGELDEELVELVELRYFAGLTIDETAKAMETSPARVVRLWRRARAWLYRELNAEPADDGR